MAFSRRTGTSRALAESPGRLKSPTHVDSAPEHQQPSAFQVIIATLASIIGSLLADMVIIALSEALMPDMKGYEHFQFLDYSSFTVVGVVFACMAWPVVTRVSSAPRRLFFRLAILVTLVLLLPDLYIWVRGESGEGVGALVVMHLAIAVVTYEALVRLAPVRAASRTA